jgi:hypothetical protein
MPQVRGRIASETAGDRSQYPPLVYTGPESDPFPVRGTGKWAPINMAISINNHPKQTCLDNAKELIQNARDAAIEVVTNHELEHIGGSQSPFLHKGFYSPKFEIAISNSEVAGDTYRCRMIYFVRLRGGHNHTVLTIELQRSPVRVKERGSMTMTIMRLINHAARMNESNFTQRGDTTKKQQRTGLNKEIPLSGYFGCGLKDIVAAIREQVNFYKESGESKTSGGKKYTNNGRIPGIGFYVPCKVTTRNNVTTDSGKELKRVSHGVDGTGRITLHTHHQDSGGAHSRLRFDSSNGSWQFKHPDGVTAFQITKVTLCFSLRFLLRFSFILQITFA